MATKMKILIAYDGSRCARSALDDLRRAGLPPEAEVVVVSVAEPLLPPPPPSSLDLIDAIFPVYGRAGTLTVAAESPAAEATRALALEAVERLRVSFPGWQVAAEGYLGSPAQQIVMKADRWQPDLVIVGSHGRSAVGRFVLGSVSQGVLNKAHGSVRIARGRIEVEGPAVRNLIGLDGYADSKAAVSAVRGRTWPAGSQVRLVTAVGPFFTALEVEEEMDLARSMQELAAAELRAAGLRVSCLVQEGDPKRLLVAEAERWGAHCVFVGTSGLNRLERFLLGSVSSAAVTHAHCSVEVVRGAEGPEA